MSALSVRLEQERIRFAAIEQALACDPVLLPGASATSSDAAVFLVTAHSEALCAY